MVVKEVKSNGYKYDTKTKSYVKINTTAPTTNENNILILENQLVIHDYLTANFDILKEVLERYKTTTKHTTLSTTNIIIDLMDDKHLSPKPKSIRINEYVYNDWQKFCSNNKLYSKQELISMALKEYMKNHSET